MSGTTTVSTPPAVSTELMLDVADPLAGTNYLMIDRLGSGGMGVVYRASHRQLGHLVAVKVLRMDADASMSARLQRHDRTRLEGQIGARLQHPGLVRVHDLEVNIAGHPCLVMELLKGQSLYERLLTGVPMPLTEALEVTCQTLSALQTVHDAGLIHRDVTPPNIFLCEDGVVKLLDLGCAKVLAYTHAMTPRSLAIPTGKYVFLGSPRYMAPEQSQANPLDGRSDIYSVGCVLYRLLAGRGPFDEARTFSELQAAHSYQLPMTPSSHLQSPLPHGLDDFLLRCLAKERNTRPDSAAAAAAELRRIALEVRETLGNGYVSDMLHPPTTMGESVRMWLPTPPTAKPATMRPGYYSVRMFWLVVAAALLLGIVLGGLLVKGAP